MSKRKKTNTASSASSAKEIKKETTVSNQQSDNLQQESMLSIAAVPPIMPAPENGSQNITFTAAMRYLQEATLTEVLTEGTKKIEQCLSQIDEITPKIAQGVSINNSEKIIETINLLVQVKELSVRLVSWNSVVVSFIHYKVNTFNEQIDDDLINLIEKLITKIEQAFDLNLTSVPNYSILGVTLAPDQKQVSETKTIISEVLSKIEKLKEENKEASQDWGAVEQNAYERILKGSNKNVSGEEFLNLLSELEQGNDV